MPSKKHYDIAIIGSGIVGASSAFQLAKNGLKVLCIDKFKAPGYGTTSYSLSVTRSAYSNYESVKTAFEGYKHFENWSDFIKIPKNNKDSNKISAQLVKVDGIMINNSNSTNFLKKSIPLMEKAKIPGFYLDNHETEKLLNKIGAQHKKIYKPRLISDPKFGTPEKNLENYGSYVTQAAGYLNDPQLATKNLVDACTKFSNEHQIKDKAEFVFGKEVVKIGVNQKGGKQEVKHLTLNDGQKIYVDKILNAAGPENKIIDELVFGQNSLVSDSKINTRVLRQEVTFVPAPKNIDFKKYPYMLMADCDNGVYTRPELSSNKLVIANFESECDELPYFDKLDDIDYNLSEASTSNIYRAALRFPNLPIPTSKNLQGIVSCYDVSDDWMPIYDKSNVKGYYLAYGTSGNQFKNAGVIGKIMAKIITETGFDHDEQPLKLDLEYTDFNGHIDLGNFSRLRKVAEGANVMG